MFPGRVLVIVIIAGVMGGLLTGCDSAERAARQAYQEGMAAKEGLRFQVAREQFRQAIALDPDYAEAHLELGILLCREGEYADGAKTLLRALEHGATSYRPHAYLGYAYEQLQRFALAEKAYRRALKRAPRYVDLRLRLADVLELQGKRQDTTEVLKQALADNPNVEQAELLRERVALLQQPDRPEIQRALADLYLRNGELRKGLRAYQSVEAMTADDPNSLARFGIFCAERQQYRLALRYLEQARQLGASDSVDLRVALGLSYEHEEQLDEALQEYQAAITFDPDFYAGHVKVADVLEALGRPAEAADVLEHVFEYILQADNLDEAEYIPDTNALWSRVLALRGEQAQTAIVEVRHSGGEPAIEAEFHGERTATLLVNDRAQYTIISDELAQALGFVVNSQTSEVYFQYSGGSYSAPLVNVKSIRIGELEAHNIPTLVWNLDEYPGIDGVLGYSFLKHFQMEFRADAQLLSLTKRYF